MSGESPKPGGFPEPSEHGLGQNGSTAGAVEPAARPSYRRALRNRPFFFLFTSQLVSQSGDFIFSVALIWLVLALTGSAFAVGLMLAGLILPGVVLGPFLGVYVDRWDRKRLLVATNLLQGTVVAVLSGFVLLGQDSVPYLFGIVLLLGAGASVVRAATTAYVPELVPVGDLPPANGLLSFSGSLNQIVGLSLGGVFVAIAGVEVPIEYDALTFFAAAALLLLIRGATPAAEPPAARKGGGFRAELAEGFAFIRGQRFMIELIVIGIVLNFFGNGTFALLAPYSLKVLHGNAATYGLLGAAVAVGSLVGGVAIGRADMRAAAGKYLFGGGIGIGVTILGLGWANVLPDALVLLVGLGVTIAVTNVPISVVMQAKVPSRMLGRVGSTFGALIVATSPLGPLWAGWTAQTWSIGIVFVISGAVFVAVLAAGALLMSSLRTVTY